jgi:hypothetical protein
MMDKLLLLLSVAPWLRCYFIWKMWPTVSSLRITRASQTYMQMQWLTSCIDNDESYGDA